jgi:hypothetical protein
MTPREEIGLFNHVDFVDRLGVELEACNKLLLI